MSKLQLVLIQGTKQRIEDEKHQSYLIYLWNRMIKDYLDRKDVRAALVLKLGDKAPPERLWDNGSPFRIPDPICFK